MVYRATPVLCELRYCRTICRGVFSMRCLLYLLGTAAGCYATVGTDVGNDATLQTQIQETAFLRQIVLKMWFLVFDFGVYQIGVDRHRERGARGPQGWRDPICR
eukprot:118475-Rhodomonas_salina.1